MQAAQKTALIVFAHQSPNSFNAAVRDVTMQELSEQGYRVIVSDLYAMNFKASATRDDIIGDLKNPELFQYGDETMHAWMEGRLCDDIVAEQRKVEEAEVIIFQFPLYWYSVPAIMKGWLDRVLTTGFAFSLQAVCNALLKKKKTVLSFTTGPIRSIFSPDEDINMKLWHLQHGTLSGCGFQVLAPQIFWCPTVAPLATRISMLDGWRARLKGLMAEEPLTLDPCVFLNVSSHEEFLMLKEKELEPSGPETGNHLAKKPLLPNNQIKAQSTGESKEKPDSRK